MYICILWELQSLSPFPLIIQTIKGWISKSKERGKEEKNKWPELPLSFNIMYLRIHLI